MSQVMQASAGVRWNAWSAEAFSRAQTAQLPIVLSIVTAWSEGCREMDRSTYADPAIAGEINTRFFPIRVDADERPDVAERYELGGVPTVAFLSPSGDLLGGGTFVDAERLRSVLQLVVPAMRRAGASDRRPLSGPGAPGAVAGDLDAELERLVFGAFDERHGGFGDAPKFPHAAPVQLALRLHVERGEPAMLARATRTLDAMGWGPLFDSDSAAFFRCSRAADWTGPHRDLLLGVNASLLGVYAEAADVTAAERYFTRTVDLVRFIETRLRRHDGAWRVSADVAQSRVLTDLNACAASALLLVSRLTKDVALGTRALGALEHVLLATYKPGEGVAHYAGGVRGLLTDHVAMIAATLDAWDESGNIVYRMMAEELSHYAVRMMWDERGGGFFDRAPLLFAAEPSDASLKPFVLNCQAATALCRLADATDDPSFAARAVDTLEAIAPLARAQGPDAAHYLLARRAVLR